MAFEMRRGADVASVTKGTLHGLAFPRVDQAQLCAKFRLLVLCLIASTSP